MTARACIVIVATVFGLLSAQPAFAQASAATPASDGRHEVEAFVVEFLKKLGDRDVDAVRAMLAPKALIAVVRQQRDGSFANAFQTRDEFMAQFEKTAGQPKFEEPITNAHVTIDSDRLAYVRADFRVEREGKILSSGVDQFTLLREPDGWKIAFVAYTSIPR